MVVKSKVFGVPLRWVAEHTVYEPPNLFADTQLSGPFAVWNHQHRFEPSTEEYSTINDRIDYRLPLGWLGSLLGSGKALRTIESMFAYRHRVTREDLELMSAYDRQPKKIAISGSTGLVGKQLTALLTLLGHSTKSIVRKPTPDENEIAIWSGDSDGQQAQKFEDCDAVVHLAGKPIAEGRWTESVKQEIRDSRVIKTRELCESLAKLERKPKVLVCASAIGIYGDRGDEVISEQSPAGDGFLSETCMEWEEACRPAVEAGIRVVNARIGLVLSPKGGALQKMLLPAQLFGGSLGSGDQWWSWIALDDALGAIYHLIQTDSISGAVNLVSPEPIQNRDFAKVLAGVYGRAAIFPAPSFALRLALGDEKAEDLLLSSTRVVPNQLSESGYKFRFSDLGETLRYYLGKNRLESAE